MTVLSFCVAATVGGSFAWRYLRAERRLWEALLERYGKEISLLGDLATELSEGAQAVSTDRLAASRAVFPEAGILLARARGGTSPWTFHTDPRLVPLAVRIIQPSGRRRKVRRLHLELKAGGSIEAVAAIWTVSAGPSCQDVVCEFAVEAASFEKR